MTNELMLSLIGGGFAIIVAMIGVNSKNQKDEAAQVQRALGRIEGKLEQHLMSHK